MKKCLLFFAVLGFLCLTFTAAHAGVWKECAEGHYDVVLGMLNANPNLVNQVDHRGWTPLHYAASHGHKQICRLLLSRGASLNIRTPDGQTAYDLARHNNHPETANALREAGGIR